MDRKRKIICIAAAIQATKYFIQSIIDDESESDSSDDELELLSLVGDRNFINPLNIRHRIPRIDNYFEIVVPSYSNQQFQSHFRLQRVAFNYLCTKLMPILETKYEYARPREQIEKKLLAVIWLLATPDSYRSVGDRFNLGKASLSDWFFSVIKAIEQIAPTLITWPSNLERRSVTLNFKKFAGLPNVLGAVDGTYIPIKKPQQNQETFLTRKCCYAYTLQAIADASLKFTDIFIGYPGSVNDRRIFVNSDIFKNIMANKDQYFSENAYILGDKAYPVLSWCLTPYVNRGNLTLSQIFFNEIHSSTRQPIERTFCLLFGRWRRLKYLGMSRTDLIPKTVLACCVLHNICLNFPGHNEAEYVREGLNIRQALPINPDEDIGEVLQQRVLPEEQLLGQRLRDTLSLQFYINRNQGVQ